MTIQVTHPLTGKVMHLHPDIAANGIWLPAADDTAGWNALPDDVLLDIIPDERLIHLQSVKAIKEVNPAA